MTPLELGKKAPQERTPTTPLFSVGFRSFFLCATLAAVILLSIWLMVLPGGPSALYWSPVRWHAHEMLFGYTTAVISGFLLTAGSNWTKQQVAAGPPLIALTALWALGRVLPLVPGAPPTIVLVVDLSFLPAVAFLLGRALIISKNKRNYLFIGLLLLLTTANALFHMEQWGLSVPPFMGRNLALRVIALIIVIIGGRIIPMFTRNGSGVQEIHSLPWLDRLAMASVAISTIAELLGLNAELLALFWILAGVLNAARMSTWGTRHARPALLWVLHAGYLSVAISFVLEGLYLLGFVPFASALHCFTIGGIGLLTMGMMARVSLGHSGRMLVAPKTVSIAFWLIVIAALIRVLTPIFAPSKLYFSWHLSGGLWVLAFALFLHFGLKIWPKPRVDQ